jgi:hypothetical protein
MAWPEQFTTLLALPDSRAAQALRWGLHGLRASLQAVLAETPADSGAEHLRGLLAELAPLLEQSPGAAAAMLPPDEPTEQKPTTPAPQTGLHLSPLVQAIAQHTPLLAGRKSPPIREGSDAEIWNDVQLRLLRVPRSLAEEWQRRCLTQAEQVGGRADDSATVVLPLPWNETIYPGLNGTIQATGLRSAGTGSLHPRVQAPVNGDLRLLAGIVSTYLWFVEHDPQLHHCLKNVFRFGMVPLNGEQRERYVVELLRLWERVRTASRQGHKEQIKALLDLDEALHSAVYQPLAAPDSWWGRLQSQARAALFRARDQAVQAGCPVHLQLLAGTYADLNRLAPDSLQVDFGVPGEVSACLRVWARVDGEEFKGRVLYRSPGDDA